MSDELSTPGRWRYITPTICDVLPDPSDLEPNGGQVLRLYEDDWRQIELAGITKRADLQLALSEIAGVRETSHGLPGFDRVYVRRGLENLLDDVAVTVSDIESSLGGVNQRFAGIGFVERPGIIPGGFAFSATNGTIAYGIEQGGLVRMVGFQGFSETPEDLLRFAEQSSLLVLDWVHALVVGA